MKQADKTQEGILHRVMREKGYSRYRIAKLVGASWNSVHWWYKGWRKPSEKFQKALEALLENGGEIEKGGQKNFGQGTSANES